MNSKLRIPLCWKAGVKIVEDAYRTYGTSYFEGSTESENFMSNLAQYAGAVGLNSEFEKMAREAASSNEARRVYLAGKFHAMRNHYTDARIVYERVLQMEPKHRDALQGVYNIAAYHVTDWETALKTLDTLETLPGEDKTWLKVERMRCLHGLKRLDDARKVGRELMKMPQFIQNYGYWGMQAQAQECEKAKNYPLAVELWEMAIKTLRAQNWQHLNTNYAAQFYAGCARAYALNGEAPKAQDCLLRGMSLIPRNDLNYKTVLQAAIDLVLKGRTLDSAVAAHENNVKADGNDKPHLRIAFAEAYKKENRTREMLAQLHYAADLLPKDMSLRKEVIDGFVALKDHDAAIAEYQRWAALDPQNITLYREWGDLYESLGRRSDALLAWATMAEVRPREAEGYRAYAAKLAGIGENTKAASALRQAVKYRPTEYDIAKELADKYLATLPREEATARNAKLWADGEAACRKAMEDLADDPLPWLNLGRFLEAQQQTKEARELYEQIILRPWPRFRNETVEEARKRLKG